VIFTVHDLGRSALVIPTGKNKGRNPSLAWSALPGSPWGHEASSVVVPCHPVEVVGAGVVVIVMGGGRGPGAGRGGGDWAVISRRGIGP